MGKVGALTLTGIKGISGSLLICLLTFKTLLWLLSQRSKCVLTSGSQTLGRSYGLTFSFKSLHHVNIFLSAVKGLFTLELLLLSAGRAVF